MSDGVGALSLFASLIGLVSLVCDVVNILTFADPGLSTALEQVAVPANAVGFLLGCCCSRAGLHLSWVPLALSLLVLVITQPVLAADLVSRVAGYVLEALRDVATAIQDILSP